MNGPLLFDEFSQPPLRVVIGGLMATATSADFAIGQVRLAGLDLDVRALPDLQQCRLLLGRFDSTFHVQTGDAWRREESAARLRRLLAFANTGRLEVRSTGLDRWIPDFSVYRGLRQAIGSARDVVLVGAHYFERPYPVGGAALTALLVAEPAVTTTAHRFEQLWERGHDVLPVITETIEQLIDSTDSDFAAEGGAGDPARLVG